MASVVNLATLTALKGKGVNSVKNVDTQFVTGQAVTTLTASADSIYTTLDAAAGSSPGYEAIGFKVLGGQKLDFGAGKDTIKVTQLAASAGATTGVHVGAGSTFDLGADDDSVVVSLNGAGSVGIVNKGKFLTGTGIDTIVVDARLNGIVNALGATIDTGSGGDKIDAASADGDAIHNEGTIIMGTAAESDVDTLTGNSLGHGVLTPTYSPGKFGIYNSGTINMGGGKDVVDALVGGFGGNGVYNLGWTVTDSKGVVTQDQDVDVVMGFGSGTFNGGGGRNAITLPGGTYTIQYSVKPVTLKDLASGTIKRDGDTSTVMTFNQFDGIGGSAPLAGLHFAFSAPLGAVQTLQSLTIAADGNVTAVNYI